MIVRDKTDTWYKVVEHKQDGYDVIDPETGKAVHLPSREIVAISSNERLVW